MLTTDKLLRDRYKVIGPYPCSPYNIGDIITMPEEGRSFHLTTTMHTDEFGERVKQQNWHAPAEILNYPNLFQPLPWWSDREISDFPEYVKYSEYYLNLYHLDGEFKLKVFKVDNWKKGHYGIKATGANIIHGYEINLIPATLIEYEAYNQQKEGMK